MFPCTSERRGEDLSLSLSLPLSLPLFLALPLSSSQEGRRDSNPPLTYSDGVSTPHQSRTAANPLLHFCREERRRAMDREEEEEEGSSQMWKE